MIKSKIVLLSALVSCALISGCKEENKTHVSIEFMHSSVEQERQAVISKLIARFEKENPGITVKQVPVEEDAYNTKVITLSRSGSLPEVIETSHDYAKVMDKEQLIDRKAVATVISNVGEGAFYDGVLRIVRTEDGSAWTGVPVSAWIGGIWYRKDVLAKAGLEEPKNWQQLLDVAQKLNDPANKKYGIALPTAESVLTEQSFSQFALSNQANVFNAEGKITLDTPEMMQALTYYRDLAANTMPGSNDIMEVKDAFMNGTAPMAIYSTYILPAVIKEGDPKNVGFVVPTEKNSAVYGMLTSLTITAGQKTEETEAAEKFVTFMEQADNIADWVMMSPGAALPVNKAVVTTATWKDNDVIKALGELPNQLISELPNIQVFGAVGDKNFTRMGDVTGSGVVSSMVHNVTVGKPTSLPRCKRARKSWMSWLNSTKPRTGIRNEQAFFRSFRYALCAAASRASLLLLGGLVAWPMVSNIEISFLRLPLNPNIQSTFVGVSNYVRILSDPGFWHSLWMTVWYTTLVVAGSTVLGLAVAMFFNREFRLRKTARSLVILSYVTPSISLVFAWKYMFNNGYGIVNYLGVDLLHLYEQAPLWFDNPGSSFVLVVLFAIWRYFPYAFISFLAILQTIDKSLYEAAEMDGANAWQRFRIVTLPAIMPVLATVVTLRTIWMFYMFADVYLLTTKVDILGVYLYKTAFAFNDLGKAAAISVVLFIIIFAVILLTRKRVNLNGNK
ncbi:ABC transporter substrate-binding protein [Escherichia coli]|uniref:Inner membrane ABC transporter permease protein YcjO n=47 Tax=Gammaproteobacteria TaxID=1236 RepID=A0A377D3Y1_ECOLX|nr:ABC transporter substrate-binding protein [Escherichia coli]